jgi:hypothetical protein
MRLEKLKQVVTIDWLEMRFSIKSPLSVNANGTICISKHLRLARNFENSKLNTPKTYLKHYYIFYKNDFVGCLNAEPCYNINLPKNSCRVRLDNWLFYSPIFTHVMQELLQSNYLNFNNFIRLDLALDTNEDLLTKFAGLYTSWKQGDLKFFGNSNKPSEEPTKDAVLQFKIKNYCCSRLVSLYNKTEEIKISNKDYQKQYFENNGLTDTVYRCEFSINNNYINSRKLLIIPMDLCSQDFTNGLFCLLVSKNLIFRTNKGKNFSREDKVYIFNEVPTFNSVILKQPIMPKTEFNSWYKNIVTFLLKKELEHGNIKLTELIVLLLNTEYDTHSNHQWLQNKAYQIGFNVQQLLLKNLNK